MCIRDSHGRESYWYCCMIHEHYNSQYCSKKAVKSEQLESMVHTLIQNQMALYLDAKSIIAELNKKKMCIRDRYYYGFNSDADEETQRVFYRTLLEDYVGHGYEGTIESKADSRSEFVGLYGGFFFIGIFLGVLFIMATVLIIYYKQISEGYDDKQRYEIMQKVGTVSYTHLDVYKRQGL